MDPTTTTTTTTNTNTNHRGTENETPPPPPPPLAATTAQPNTKSLSFTNGKLKKHSNHPHHHHHHPPPPPAALIYKECLKNHAATLGGYAVDGCGEFMPSPTEPTSLKCAACGCHRNFHRRGDEPTTTTPTHFLDFHHRPPPPLSVRRSSPSSSSLSPPPPPSYYSAAPHMLLALSASDHHHPEAAVKPTAAKAEENPSGRKRNRTKFSQDQKEKMLSFSEKLGWKMMKSDQGLIESFCNEIGVGRGVFKVWMHNNKNTFGKKDTITTTTTINNVSENINDGRVVKSENNNGDHHRHQSENNNGGHHLHVSSANGCPPSAQPQLDPKTECRF